MLVRSRSIPTYCSSLTKHGRRSTRKQPSQFERPGTTIPQTSCHAERRTSSAIAMLVRSRSIPTYCSTLTKRGRAINPETAFAIFEGKEPPFRTLALSCRAKNGQRDSDARSQSKHPYLLLNPYQTREGDQPETRLPQLRDFRRLGITIPQISLSCRAKNEQRDSDARSQSKHPYLPSQPLPNTGGVQACSTAPAGLTNPHSTFATPLNHCQHNSYRDSIQIRTYNIVLENVPAGTYVRFTRSALSRSYRRMLTATSSSADTSSRSTLPPRNSDPPSR
jgi:hypothetical protein